MERVIATDMDLHALVCAQDNIKRLTLAKHVQMVFPRRSLATHRLQAARIPARPNSPMESAIFDPDGRIFRGFIDGLAANLEAGGKGRLILSYIAEHLGLRSCETLFTYFAAANLTVTERHNSRPSHPCVADATDPLHAAREAEVTSSWRVGVR